MRRSRRQLLIGQPPFPARGATTYSSDLRSFVTPCPPLDPAPMILLNVSNITKHFGPDPVLDGVAFEVRPGDKIGLVGPNGAGKTTLLKILAGKLSADAGSVELHSSARLEYLEQQPTIVPGRTLWDEAASALESLSSLAHDAERTAQELSQADRTGRTQAAGRPLRPIAARADASRRLQHRPSHRARAGRTGLLTRQLSTADRAAQRRPAQSTAAGAAAAERARHDAARRAVEPSRYRSHRNGSSDFWPTARRP